MKSKFGTLILVLLSSFAGGYLSNALIAHAQDVNNVIAAKMFELIDGNGKVIGTWTACENNSPCLNFYDGNKNIRLNMGLYGAPSENGLPFIGLYDEKYNIKELLRLYGPALAPVFVMKNNGEDRLIEGLNFQDSEAPFLVTINKDGSQKVQFGQYAGK